MKQNEKWAEESEQDYHDRLSDAVLSCWEHDGGKYIYYTAERAGLTIEDGWGDYGARLNSHYGFDVKALKVRLANRAADAAHALEAEIQNAAHRIADDLSNVPEEDEEDVPRGPEHDVIVYRYAGTNDTIAGASAKGLYVAELSLGHLKDESRELGHCIGDKVHGHPELLSSGTTKVFSIRTESGRSKFTIELFVEDGEHPQQGRTKAGTVTEVKGKANRFPGFDPGSKELTHPDEVKFVTEFLMKGLPPEFRQTPAQIEQSSDIRGGVLAMKALGLDPYSPPPKKAPRPKRDPRAMQAAVRAIMADYRRIP